MFGLSVDCIHPNQPYLARVTKSALSVVSLIQMTHILQHDILTAMLCARKLNMHFKINSALLVLVT